MAKHNTSKAKSRSPSKKIKKGAWFVKTRGSYMPASVYGWMLYAPMIVAEVLLIAAVSAGIHEGVAVGTAYVQFVFGTIFLWGIFTWMAKQLS
jgi:hypothetical protein